MKLLVLRPQPGADATVRRARALRLDAVAAPLFTLVPLEWDAPDACDFDAIVMTSANAARHGGPGLANYRHLPAFAVGPATAAAMQAAGFAAVTTGDRDVSSLLATIPRTMPGARVLHPGGAHRARHATGGIDVHDLAVYEAVAASALPPIAAAACRNGVTALLHSPRAAALFARLLDAAAIDRAGIGVIAISDAVAAAAGTGWKSVAASPAPTEAAMLAIARALCDMGAS